MAGDKTFMMIKPDGVEKGFIGSILKKISANGFKFNSLKMTQLSVKEAKKFYGIHKERPFFQDLIDYITRSSVVVAIIEKDNAVAEFRQLIGSTNPEDAEEGTIRKQFATSISENVIHGSDSDDNAKIEMRFHFSGREIF